MNILLRNSTLILLSAMLAVGCSDGRKPPRDKNDRAKKTVITQKGSDTMVLLAQRWAEIFHDRHPNIDVQVSGGGSGTGIAALINGTTDITNASRTMKDEEKRDVRAQYGDLVEIPVARDAIAIYVHPSNPIRQLTLEQLGGIYSGTIDNWKDLGGKDSKIILYGRENSSGTYEYFKNEVLDNRDFDRSTQTLQGTAAIVSAITKDPNGIGYGGAAYDKGVKAVMLVGKEGTPVAISEETVASGAYPLSRLLYIYTGRKPSGAIKTYIDWVLSPQGQAVVSEVEYFPL